MTELQQARMKRDRAIIIKRIEAERARKIELAVANYAKRIKDNSESADTIAANQ